jgi:hypothetical protein
MSLCNYDKLALVRAVYATYNSDVKKGHHGCVLIRDQEMTIGYNHYSTEKYTVHAEESVLSETDLGAESCLLPSYLKHRYIDHLCS